MSPGALGGGSEGEHARPLSLVRCAPSFVWALVRRVARLTSHGPLVLPHLGPEQASRQARVYVTSSRLWSHGELPINVA